MNILLTGATGFIGSHLTDRLVSDGHNVCALIRSDSSKWRLDELMINSRLTFVDITKVSWPELFSSHSFDALFHLAAKYVKFEKDEKDSTLLRHANIEFPSTLLHYASQSIPFFINTGTCFEYEEKNTPISETDMIQPYNYYAATKCAFERILSYCAHHTPMKAATLKLFYPYGEKDNKKVIPMIIDAILNRKKLLLSDEDQELGYTYVSDIVDAYIKTLSYLIYDNVPRYSVFNIGNRSGVSVKTVYSLIKSHAESDGDYVLFSEKRTGKEFKTMTCDGTKADKMLRFAPKVSIEEGLKKTYNYYAKHANRLPL